MSITKGDFDELFSSYVRLEELVHPGTDYRGPLQKWQLELTPAQQRIGLQSSLSEVLQECLELPVSRHQEIDEIMRNAGLKTLSQMQVSHGTTIRRLLKKESLAREDDVIFLRNLLDAGDLDATQTEHVNALVETYFSNEEASQKRSKLLKKKSTTDFREAIRLKNYLAIGCLNEQEVEKAVELINTYIAYAKAQRGIA